LGLFWVPFYAIHKNRGLGQFFFDFPFCWIREKPANFGANQVILLHMGPGKNSPRGRNLCCASQQGHVEHLLSPSEALKKSQSYTPRGSAVKKPTPAKKKPRLPAKDKAADERAGAAQAAADAAGAACAAVGDAAAAETARATGEEHTLLEELERVDERLSALKSDFDGGLGTPVELIACARPLACICAACSVFNATCLSVCLPYCGAASGLVCFLQRRGSQGQDQRRAPGQRKFCPRERRPSC